MFVLHVLYLQELRVHVAGRVIEFTFWEWMSDLRWGAVQALFDFGFDSNTKCSVSDQFC